MTRILLRTSLLFLAIAASCASPAPDPHGPHGPHGPHASNETREPDGPNTAHSTRAAHTIRIGTWNLEHFGRRKPRRTEQDLARIAAMIKSMACDVLAVQEIDKPAALGRLMHHLGDDYRLVLGTTGGFDGTFISVGFVFNRTRVEVLQCEEMTDFPSKVGELHVFHRKPVNAVFRVKGDGDTLDFRAITVHFKASRGTKNEAKRKAEVTILRDYIEKLRARDGEDQDIVVIGDFNHTYGAPAHRVFANGDFVRYLRGSNTPTIVHFDDPIDQIAIIEGLREEVVPGSFKVHNGHVDYARATGATLDAQKQAWRGVYSDHFPVTLDLDASIDRDPQATFAAPVHSLPIRK